MIRLILIVFALTLFSNSVMAQRTASPVSREATPSEEELDKKDVHSPLMDRVQQQKEAFLNDVVHRRVILILAQKTDRREIIDMLKGQGSEILETHILGSLDSVLIITKGDNAALQELRLKFPNAEIDWNDDLSASEQARLYAREKIKWPGKGACLDKALTIPIGLIDGKIDRAHPAFAGQGILEKNFLGNALPDKQHATAIASILIGNAPDQGFDGLLAGAKLYSAVAMRRAPDDKQLASVAASVRGLDWLLAQDVRLINVSLAGDKNRVLVRSFETALAKGVLIFAAAGNKGPEAPPAYPAAINGVFAITAMDAAGRNYKQANQGDYIDFAAPGVDIWVATSNEGGAYKSGTSYASPYALGAAALYLGKNQSLSAEVLSKALSETVIDLGPLGKDHTYGAGLLQNQCQDS